MSDDDEGTVSAVLNQQCQTCFKNCTSQEAMKCGACKSATYCSKECQKAHWKAHKIDCRARTSSSAEQRMFPGAATYQELQAFTSVHRAALCNAAMQALNLSRKDQRKRVKTETVLFVFEFNPDPSLPAGKKFTLGEAEPMSYDELTASFPSLPQLSQLSTNRTKFEEEMFARGEKDGHQLLLVLLSGVTMNIVPFVTHDSYLDDTRTRLMWKEEFGKIVKRGVSI